METPDSGFQASEEPAGSVQERDFITNWQHRFAGGSALQLQGYYDLAKRQSDSGNGGFCVDTCDLSAQHQFNAGTWNQIIWRAEDWVIS